MKLYLKQDTAWLLLIAALSLLVRLALLLASDFVIDSDEAIVGLMAKHILEGREFPIFYYGQDYMGSFEAILSVPFFVVFGKTSFALKLVPLLFSLLQVLLVYELASRFSDRFAARLASFFCALGPSALILWSTKARGGFIELVALGTLALILSVDLLKEKEPRAAKFAWLGALLGLAWWINNQIVFYIIAIVVAFFIHFVRHLGFAQSLKLFAVSCGAFLLGSLPFWVYNLQAPLFRTINFLLSSQGGAGASFLDNLEGFFFKALPIIFGARRFWTEEDVFPGASLLVYLVYLLAFVAFFCASFKSKERSAHALILLFLLSATFIFSASSFGWLSLAPRYLLPLYSVIFLILAASIAKLREKSSTLAHAAVFIVLAVNFASNYYPRLVIPGEPFIYRGERVAKDQSELYSWLKANNYRHINANYWIGYRAAFETNEEITFTRLGSPRTLRIPEYEMRGGQGEEQEEPAKSRVYVGVPSEIALLSKTLTSFGYSFRQSQVSAYLVLDKLKRDERGLVELELKPAELRVSERSDLVPAMLDHNLETRWGSSKPQYPGMLLEIRFAAIENIAAVYLEMGKFAHDGPRELRIEGQDGEGSWNLLFDSYGTRMFYDALEGNFGALPAKWDVHFKARKLQAVRLVQKGSDPIFDWSIAELKVFVKK